MGVRGSAPRPGRPYHGKDPVPILQEAVGGPQGRYGRAENLVPTGIRSRTVQPVVSRYTDWATRPTLIDCYYKNNKNGTTLKQLFKEQDLRKFYKPGFPFDFPLCNKFSYGSLVGSSRNLIPLLLLLFMQHRPKCRTDKYTHARDVFRTSSPSVRKVENSTASLAAICINRGFFAVFTRAPPPVPLTESDSF